MVKHNKRAIARIDCPACVELLERGFYDSYIIQEHLNAAGYEIQKK